MRMLLYANSDKPAAVAARGRLVRALPRGLESVESDPECVVVLGGDGTMLAAAHEFPGVPLLGFNLGSLGYLSTVGERDFDAALRSLASGSFSVAERTALALVGSGRSALNEIVISRGVSGHAALLELSVDGLTATRYLADGLVFATPTGSTAYSLSAGGPILLPESRAFAVTPICPHALASRPVVVPDSSRFSVRLVERPFARAAQVFADGEAVRELAAGETVEIAKSERVVRLVSLPGYNPYRTLNRKLGWGGNSLAGGGRAE